MAYLFSLTTDTHTQIYPDLKTPGFSNVYPIRFRTFADGLYILSADHNYEQHIGKRVISFGEKDANEVMGMISNYVSAYFKQSFINFNSWNKNYWDNWGGNGFHRIYGDIDGFILIEDWFMFDLRPVEIPYNI